MWILDTLFEQNRFSFDNLTHVVLWTKSKLVHKSPLKRLVLKSQFQNPRNLADFFTTHAKTTSNLQWNTKQIKYAFTPTARSGIIKGTNKILHKN